MRRIALLEALGSCQDPTYRDMQIRLIPNVAADTIIGVRTPQLRRMARELEDKESFQTEVPHRYFEENQIHAFLLNDGKDFVDTVEKVSAFLPYVDNWATCDQLRPQIFGRHKQELLPYIYCWIASDHPYTIRFGISMLMCHFLDEAFSEEYPAMAASAKQEDYYVKMMIAWYFATALAKQYDAVLPYIQEQRLEPWVHNKAIQKAVESLRIPEERKEILRGYRIKCREKTQQ